MIIKSITPGDLRHMYDQEALILQGCGGDLTEWVEGINGILTEEEILKDGFRFKEAYTFKNEGLTCLIFPLDDGSKINMGKLAMWRIGTHHNFGGTWLSDYVENRLGGFARDQPVQQSSDSALTIIGDYVNITSSNDQGEDFDEGMVMG